MDTFIGPAAGVTTSLLWTATSLCFTAASRRIGVLVVNCARLALAVALLAVTHRVLTGLWWPEIAPKQLVLLGASGVIGLALGDQALFTSFIYIGPRLAMLIMTTSPIFAALFGWMVLGEQLVTPAYVGMFLVIGGVGWVLLERADANAPDTPTSGLGAAFRARGIVLALVGAACQAGGLLLSKQGMGHGWLPREEHLGPQAATLVRMVFGAVGMTPLLLWHAGRRWRYWGKGLRDSGIEGSRPPDSEPRRVSERSARDVRLGYLLTVCGTVVGPFLGVWMSLVASDRSPLGVAQTLCSLAPIFIMPCVWWLYRERVSPRAVLGAVIAVAGAAILFWPVG